MTFGLCRSQPACRPHPASTPVRFLRSRVCYALLSASPRGYALRFATVAVIGSGWLLSSNKILPMLGTLGRTPWSARDAPVPLLVRGRSRRGRRLRTRGSAPHFSLLLP